ncbi:toprim domain-containing protein [Candidatus Carsonella ruddii]|uniref:toprim domain-containing protein n=1 Tax=Carsonella ruddii TaxID=114186 RepID=UPI003D5A8257
MNFKCPFHNDINASLSLKKNIFLCYGCNLKGKLQNVDIKNFNIKNFNFFFDKNTIFNSKKNLYLKKNFWLNYLYFRKINISVSMKFSLGMLNFTYNNNKILLNRLMFPIINYQNILIGVGLKTNSIKNKYINLFKLNILNEDLFFGINNIKHYNYIIVVEGYFDALTIYKNSFLNVISNLGCNINYKKICFLLSKFKKIYFCFDGDIAGFNSSEKIKIEFNKYYKKRIYIKNMPSNFDPDNFINFFGIKSFLKYLII